MPRKQNRGGGGSRGRGGGGRGRGGGGGAGGFRGGHRGGRGGVRGGAVRKPAGEFDRFKKFKHIQRNQEAEELLRQRKGLELQHEQQQQRARRLRDEELVSSSDEEADPMDQLLTALQTQSGGGGGKAATKKSAAIESSDSELSDMDDDEDGEEAEEEEDEDLDPELGSGADDGSDLDEDDEMLAEEEEEDDSNASDEEDSDGDFQINEQFEQQSERKPAAPKPKTKPTEKNAEDEDDDEDDESDSSDEDEDQLLRPEESTKQKRSTLERSADNFVIADDDDDDDTEAELDEDIDRAEQADGCAAAEAVDTFSVHLDHELSPALLECVSTTHSAVRHELLWPRLGRLQLEIPNAALDTATAATAAKNSATTAPKRKKPSAVSLLDADTTYAAEGTVPERFAHRTATAEQLGLKSQLHPHVATANAEHLAASPDSRVLTGLQAELFSVMANYQDLYYPGRTLDNAEEIRFAYCLHALNHILKTRTKILHHNAKLGRLAEAAQTPGGRPAPVLMPDAYRDQGLFRPKVLIVVPFRESARRIVNQLVALLHPERGEKVMHYARFEEEFGGDGLYFPKRNPKPEDYERTFAGNSDDTFRLGICLTRKCMKLYADFYSSDILIVSPLGLRMVVGAAGEKDRDYDFLASVEMLVLDQAELFVAQNWDHLLHVMDHLHLQPQSARNTDFSRVRSWCLNGWTRFYRQTLLLASHELPEFRALFNGRCANYRGRVRIANPVLSGSIRHVAVPVAQVFHRVEVASIQTSFDQRFQHFVQHVLPQFKAATMAHCLILVPSYFDFVRLRNYFKKESLNFVQICEYTKDGKMARSRDMFFHSGAHFMLYSERAHFFRRTRVKGIRHLIMYQPPTWPQFYAEMVNLMQEAYQNPRDGAAGTQTVTVLYTRYDMLQVAAVVGSERAAKMAASDKATHMFMTGD